MVGSSPERSAEGGGTLDDLNRNFQSPERVLYLLDEVMGLQAELAQMRYQHDQDLDELRRDKVRLESSLEESLIRAVSAERRIDDLLASRSWRIGQLVLRPFGSLRRLVRRRSVP